MSAYRWLAFAVGVPLSALLIGVVYRFAYPAVDVASQYSTSDASTQGLAWYTTILDWLPFVVLLLLAFMVIVAVIVRRRRVVRP